MRGVAAALLCVAALLSLTACYTYKAVPLQRIDASEMVGRHMKFTMKHGAVHQIEVASVTVPWVTGRSVRHRHGKWVKLDLREVESVEVRSFQGARTFFAVVGTLAGLVLVGAIIVAATKESCPFVYIDRGNGAEVVGEAYAGAGFRSLERPDLLPIPDFPRRDGGVDMWLTNEAHETQFTDQIELVVVDHPPDVRALAAHDARLVYASDRRAPPRRARDLSGAEVTSQVREQDGRVWQSDMDAAAAADRPALREGIVATFDAPQGDAPLLLEIHGGNTLWIDLVFGRFFAAMGSEGYYNVHRPPQSEWMPGTLVRIRDEPGAFARFGLDLYRAYQS